MSYKKHTSQKGSSPKRPWLAVLCLLILAIGGLSSFQLTQSTLSASEIARNKYLPTGGKNKVPAVTASSTPAPENTPPSKIPPQIEAQRIKIVAGETREITVSAEITSVVAVSPEIAAADVKNGRTMTVTALKIGETILILSGAQKRLTYVVEVTKKPSPSERQNAVAVKYPENRRSRLSGTVNLQYSAGSGGNPSLLRHSVELKRDLSEDKTFRFSSDSFKFWGADEGRTTFAKIQTFGLNRMSLGVDSPGQSIDVLDSRLQISPLGFNNFAMRGFHLVKKSKTSPTDGKAENGLEIFAGQARPSLSFFDDDNGYLAGLIVPLVRKKSVTLRAGLISILPQKENRFGQGGTVLQLNGSATPFRDFRAEGEMSYANGNLSWQVRLNFNRPGFGGYGEIIRLDQKSPFNSIGAQPGGRKTETAGVYWRPNKNFGASLSFNHTEVTRQVGSGLANFDRTTFFTGANYKLGRHSQLKFRFSEQTIETAVPGGSTGFEIETRTFSLGYNTRLNSNWSNNFEARINLNRETQSDAGLEKGFTISEQLRFSWRKNSISGFLNYTDKTPSLSGLIVRNPQILPPLLQQAYTLNPAQFLQLYRDRAAMLLGGVELPLTRSLETGVYLQTSVSRLTINGEARYHRGEISAEKRNNFYTALNLNLRLDAANSVQVAGWKSFGSGGQAALTFSFTHRFGEGGGEGFQFSKLFGFDRGKIQGRVYFDSNGNGQDDAGEPGVAGMIVQLDEKRSVKTDINGRYIFRVSPGNHHVALNSEELGRRWRASSPTGQQIFLSARQTANLNFGVSDFGFVAGRVFNDLRTVPEAGKLTAAGIKGVRILLRPLDSNRADETRIVESGAGGDYEFPNLRPGEYLLEIDPATLPGNFRYPEQTSWQLKIQPLRGVYFDIPLTAQRAVAGVVFVDKNGDGQFNAQIDTPVEGADIVTSGGAMTVSDANGEYILRNLPAGKVTLRARSPQGAESFSLSVELGAEPVTKRAVNFIISR